MGFPTSPLFAAIVQTDLIHTFKSVFSSSVAWPFRQLPKIFFMTLFRMSTTVQSNFIIKTCGRDYSVNFGVRVPKFFVYLQNNIPQLFAQAIFSKTPLKLFFPVKRIPPKLPLVHPVDKQLYFCYHLNVNCLLFISTTPFSLIYISFFRDTHTIQTLPAHLQKIYRYPIPQLMPSSRL